MTDSLHPAATGHLPWFITSPGQTDTLLVFTTVVLVATVLGIGILFFRLHSLPERLGHSKFQFEIVAVLGLLSLFTHIHLFWVAGLLLALIDFPDFQTPLKRMAGALDKMAGTQGDAASDGPVAAASEADAKETASRHMPAASVTPPATLIEAAKPGV